MAFSNVHNYNINRNLYWITYIFVLCIVTIFPQWCVIFLSIISNQCKYAKPEHIKLYSRYSVEYHAALQLNYISYINSFGTVCQFVVNYTILIHSNKQKPQNPTRWQMLLYFWLNSVIKSNLFTISTCFASRTICKADNVQLENLLPLAVKPNGKYMHIPTSSRKPSICICGYNILLV